MNAYRVFHPSTPVDGETVELTAAESHHLLRVRRARSGDPVDAFDGRGTIAHGTLQAPTGKAALIKIERIERMPEPPVAIRLLLPLAKAKAFETVVQKATELGVREIQPVHTRHCEVELSADRASAKVEKWEAIALESLKQCGNPFLPKINSPRPFTDLLGSAAEPGSSPSCRLVAALHPDARPVARCLADALPPSAIDLLVGPEGDLSAEEYAAAFAAGFRPFTLGPFVLRVDTAAIAAIALIMDHLRPTDDLPKV